MADQQEQDQKSKTIMIAFSQLLTNLKQNYKTISVGLVILILIFSLPIGVNSILATTNPLDNLIVGEGKDWISFYGSYSGGIITGLISFIILYKTINATRQEAKINRKRQDLESLSRMLEDIASLLVFGRIGNVALFHKNIELCQNEMINLDKIRDEVQRKRNAIHLFYDREKKSHIREYILALDLAGNKMIGEISEMIILVSHLNGISPDLLSIRKPTMHRIDTIINRQSENKTMFANPLYQAAQSWLEIEKIELENMEK